MRGLLAVPIALAAVCVPDRYLPVHAADAAVTGRAASSLQRQAPAREGSTALSSAQGRGRGKKAAKSGVPEYREVLLRAGTPLFLELRSPLASDTSEVEDAVRARLLTSVTVDGKTVLPAGTQVVGYVTDVERSGRVKGRSRLALRFSVLRHDGDEYEVRTKEIERVADSTKANDVAKVGIGTGAGAAVGAILGGGSGAATGAAIGAAAGTGTVLATKGDDVRLEVGERLETQLTAPLRVLIQTR